jgi:hypothetical protein
MICAALEGGTARKVDGFKCLPPRPSKTGRAIRFGIQTKSWNLARIFLTLTTVETRGNKYVQVYKFVSAKSNLHKRVKFRPENT